MTDYRNQKQITQDFAANLKEKREQRGYLTAEFAAYMFMNSGNYCRYEKGLCMPGIERLERIAYLLECNVSDLLKARKTNTTSKSLEKSVINPTTEKGKAQLDIIGEIMNITTKLESGTLHINFVGEESEFLIEVKKV